jgi:endonuclease/exonuclease/phosphatase family metal-dependent hydrolase
MISPQLTSPQSHVKLMKYNLLNYSGADTITRNPYLREKISSINPDIILVQEMIAQAGVDGFKNIVLLNNYSAGTFLNDYDTENAII